jgi:hypothetical protein
MKKLSILFILVFAMILVMTACEGDPTAPARDSSDDKSAVVIGPGIDPEPHPATLPWLEFRDWLWEHTFDKPSPTIRPGA